jgi:DNA polymerase III epsilon subunit-like protein
VTYYMLDCETMGTNPETDDMLEIGILELFDFDGFLMPGRAYNRKLFTSQKPKDDWIATNHADLIRECRKVPMIEPEKVRAEVLKFCGPGPINLVGLNVMSLDVPFMLAKGFFKPGDFHYRIFEMRGSINTACRVLRLEEKALYEEANRAFPEIELPEGKKHQALYDCYKQTKTLNGIIRLLREKAG